MLRLKSISFKMALVLMSLGAVILIVAIIFFFLNQSKNPIPASIQTKLGYKAIYPSPNSSYRSSSTYDYNPEDKSLTFSSKTLSGVSVTIVEQPAPDSLSAGGQVYYPAIGIHPYAQFQSKLGPVALTKFWQADTLSPQGQTAVLAVNGTLFLAHPDKDLTNAEWKDFFNNLTISK